MKKVVSILLMAGLVSARLSGQCPPQFFTTQAQIDAFPTDYPGCSTMHSMEISGDDIVNLNGLSGITSVKIYLLIHDNDQLSDLTGLDNLQYLPGVAPLVQAQVDIKNNASLTSLEGLGNLSYINGNLYIEGNPSLAGLTGIAGLHSAWSIIIVNNESLITLEGLENHDLLNTLIIEGNTSLVSLAGLEHLEYVYDDLIIEEDSSLTDLTGLEKLTSVGNIFRIKKNASLSSLEGLDNFTGAGIDTFEVAKNAHLTDCATSPICFYFGLATGTVIIADNFPGCNTRQEVEADCAADFNMFAGNVYVDLDCNGLFDGIDQVIPNHFIRNLDDSLPLAFTNQNGDYFQYLLPMDTAVFAADPLPGYSVVPGSYTLYTADTLQGFAGYDFRLCPDSLFHNVKVTLTPYTLPRPNFTNKYKVCAQNTGTYPEDATLTFDFSDLISGNYVTIVDPDGGTVDGPRIQWSLDTIPLFTTQCFDIKVHMAGSTPVGTLLYPRAQIELPEGIEEWNLADNTVQHEQLVVGSYDPNDKTVSPAEVDFSEAADGVRLENLIRFQNVGTAQAIFIEVLDTLEENLDMTTFEMIAASHPYTLSFPAPRVLKWRFAPIFLPPASWGPFDSEGFIHFSIDCVPGLSLTDVVSNTAAIYFDFNAPVITNTATTSFFVGVQEVANQHKFQLLVAPNPTTGFINLKYTLPEASDCRIEMLNTQGAVIRYVDAGHQPAGLQDLPVNLSGLPPGIYAVRLRTSAGTGIAKVLLTK